MAASVLNSPKAVQVSLLIVRAFVRLRQVLLANQDLARRLDALEREFVSKTVEHEQHIQRIYEILHELMNPPVPPRKSRIGFAPPEAHSRGGLTAARPRSVRRIKSRRTGTRLGVAP